jgi:hypothetical protein
MPAEARWRSIKLRILPMIRDVLFVMGCAAGVLLAISQYISMFSE